MQDQRPERTLIKALLLSAGVLALPVGAVQADSTETASAAEQKISIEVSQETKEEATEAATEEVAPEAATEEATTETAAEAVPSTAEAKPTPSKDTTVRAARPEFALTTSVPRIAPPDVVRQAQRRNGRFYDAQGNRIINRWVECNGVFYFSNTNATTYTNRFVSFGGDAIYYLDEAGRLYAGVLTRGSKKYLLDETTGRLHRENRWVNQLHGKYFPNAAGELYYNRFISMDQNAVYYVGDTGKQQTGVIQVNGQYYLMDETMGGKMRRDNTWVSYHGKDYFPKANGELYRNQFITFGKDIAYYLGEDGSKQVGRLKLKDAFYILHPVTGQVQFRNAPGYRTVDGQRFYVDATGAFRSVGQWVTKNGKSYYQKGDGTYYHNEEITVAQKRYYIGADGATTPGVHRVGQKLYYYDPALNNERRQRSGVVQWRGQQYYVGSKGNILTNQIVQVGDTVKQADANGILRTTTRRLVIDLSYHQRPEDFNFDAFTNGVSGVILRAGYTGHGTGNSYYRDTAFERFYREFNARGIPIGAYWYACANTVEEGIAEAKEFKKALAGKKFALPVYWDTEDQYHQRHTDKKTLTDTALAFLKEMEKSGYYTGIYASASWFYEKLQMERLKDYDVWVAHYGVATPAYHGDYNLWQFTSKYKKDGFPRQLDANWMLVDYPAIIKKARRNGF